MTALVEQLHLRGQHDQQKHAGGRGRDPLAPGTGVYQDDYGTLEIRSTGVDRIRQAVYDYLGGEDVFDIVVNEDGSVDVENMYGSEGTIEGEQALEAYLNEGGIDVNWDGDRGSLHASYRGAINDDPVMKEFTSRVESKFSGAFETPDGQEFSIGETRFAFTEANGENAARAEVNGSILNAEGEQVGTFSRAVYDDGVVYNHSLNIYPEYQGQGIGTAFLDRTEAGPDVKEIRMTAAAVGKYAWAARGYRLDTRGSREVAAAARDQWLQDARNALSRTPEWRANDFTTIDKLGALEREWMRDLNSVYPGDLLAIDPSLKSVLINGPSWDAIRELNGGLTAAAGVTVFHLQGQHDQQNHAGGRGGDDRPWEGDGAEDWSADTYADLYDTYTTSIVDKSGREFFVDVDITMDVGTPWAAIEGTITNEIGDPVGQFQRTIDFEESVVVNDTFSIVGDLQGQGIGTAFLDQTEGALAAMGIKDASLEAVGIGKAAWAARGYRVSEADRQRSMQHWTLSGRRYMENRGGFTDDQVAKFDAVTKSWADGADVYPGDLLAIDDRFANVLINSERVGRYYATKPLVAQPRMRPWNDPNQQTLFAAGVQVFHLQGGHDQQTHAGDRASSALGEDVTLDDLDGDIPEGVTADEIVSRFDLSDGGQEHATTSGGRLYRAPDDRYVLLDPEGDDVYVTIVSDLYEAEGNIDVDQIESDIEDSWREDVVRGPVYHGTRDDESLQSIVEGGLERRDETRGLNNRSVGQSVFTTVDPELASQYGSVVEVDLPRAIADGVVDPLDLSREPGYNRADAMQQIAYSFDDYSYDPYSQYVGSGEDPNTVIIGANIPPEYIRPLDELSGAIEAFRAEMRVADRYAVYRPMEALSGLEAFHLQGQHDQQKHAGGGGFSPDQIASWESTKPWNLTKNDAMSQNVPGWWHKSARGSEAASFEDGYIRPTDEFYELPEEARRAVAYHEAGHGMVEAAGGLGALERVTGYDFVELMELPGASALSYNAEEVIAEAYSVLWTEPSWFAGKEQIRNAAVAMAEAAEFPLPSSEEVLAVETFHLQGQHDQQKHGDRGSSGTLPSGAPAINEANGWTFNDHPEFPQWSHDRWGVLNAADVEAGGDRMEMGEFTDVVQLDDGGFVKLGVNSVRYNREKADKWGPAGEVFKPGSTVVAHAVHSPEFWRATDRQHANGIGQITMYGLDRGKETEKTGEIIKVDVVSSHQRRGVATEMWKFAKAQIPNARHSKALTDAGSAWNDYLDAEGLALTVFHLQGQHDQQNHAGGRGGDGLGYDPRTEIPPQRPGESPIPEGAVRLTHRTWSNNVDSIMENGLGGEHARQYDFEGEVVWAAAGVAYGQEEIGGPWQAESDITFFEFWMMPDELIIGRGDDPAQLESRSSHVTMRDVPPERFVGVYEPWHAAYWAFESRTAGTFEEVKSGFYDSVGEANPDTYGKAMDYIKSREDLAVQVFHLQGQHDQQRHAGGRGGGVPDEFAQAGDTYTDEAKAHWAAGAAYLSDPGNEMPEFWLGLDYMGEDGLPVGRGQVGFDYDATTMEELTAFRDSLPDEVEQGIWMIARAADERRKEAIAEAITMNKISVEDANDRYEWDAKPDRDEWRELPSTLYHATSKLGAISADGALKTRREIGGRAVAAGLGGGTDNTISFTSDRQIAEGIARSLHEAHRALNMDPEELVAELEARAGSWWPDVQDSAANVHSVRGVPQTIEEQYNLYRSFTFLRQTREGVLDPLFFNVNPENLRDMDPGEIGIVEVMPAVTGAKGYQVSSLGEWRTTTGAATEITQFIETDPVDQFGMRIVQLGTSQFHLEGQHDQSTHGRRGADPFDVMTKAYNTTFDAPDGSRYEIRADIEMTNRDRWTKAKGTIHDENGQEVGKFLRLVDNESGRVDNVNLKINPDHQARGIGIAFLDQTEAALEAELDVSHYSVSAQEVGRYAWAARGYRLAKFGGGTDRHGIRTRELWSEGARERYGSLTSDQQQRSEAVLAGWAESGDNVYPADLIAISPEFKDVFLSGPEWLGYREVKRGSTQGLSLAQFHLQGQHDQQSHAGTNARGQDIADVGGTIPEKRNPGDVLDEWMSSPEEFEAAQKLAAEKARNVPKPTPEQIAKNKAMLAKSKRPGGWGRGNSYTRRARGQALFEEFGGKPGGSCPCAHCGIKVSPGGEGGFAQLTQDKILVASEGGTYGTAKSGFPNLIPSCGGCNSSRNEAAFPVQPEWAQDELPLAAAAGRNTEVTADAEFVAAAATGKPVGWDTWLEPEVGDTEVTGEYITRQVDTWFGPYTQHLIAGEVCDPDTIDISAELSVEQFHLQGQHNQADHGNRATATIAPDVAARVRAGESITVSPSEVADVVAQFADQEGPMDLAAIDVEGYPNLFSGARANVTAREDMPQIPKAHLQQFREELEADGITVEEVQLNASELSATQRQLDAVKVAGVADAIRNGEFKVDHRIWVSHDNRILDGHHRWAAAAIVELEGHPASAPLDGYRVDMDMEALLVKARAYNEEHGVDARTYRAHMEALGLNPGQHFHLQGQHDQQTHAGDSAPADDYQGGHRPSETGPRIHDLLESEMTDGLDVYQNPQFFTGYAKAELDETMAQLRRVQGDPEANVTIYRAAPEGATINEGDWVSLSETYARLHADSGNAGDTPAVVEMEVPAKTVRWAVDDLMEYGYFPDLGEQRIFSEDDLAVQVFHLEGQHDQSNHGNRGGGRDLGPAQARALVEAAPPIVRNKATAEHEAAVKALQSVGRGIYDSAYSTLSPEQVSILNGAPTLDPDIFPKEHDAIRRVEQVLAERTMASLRQARPFGRDPEFTASGDPEFTGVVEEAAAMYPTDWMASSYGVSVEASGTTGGWYDQGTIGLPKYSPTDPAGIPRDTSKKLYRAAVHELGHHLEVENPNVLKAAQMFLATRKSGAFKPGSSVGVPSKHKVVDGDFRNPYSGVFYDATDIGGSGGTEVLTTHMYSMQFALDGPSEPNWSIQDRSLFAPPPAGARASVRDAWLEETYYALGVLASL